MKPPTELVLQNQPFTVIYDEYHWEPEHQPAAKDDILLSVPPSLFLDIFSDSIISNFPCVNPSMDASTTDHSQNTPDVSPSFKSGEEKSFIENPLDFSSTFSRSAEGEHSCFSSIPLFDLSDHEDAYEIIDFSDRSCRDSFTPVFDHDVDSITVDFSKSYFYDDLSVDEVKTPYTVEALQPELMVISGPRCLQVSFIIDQEIF